MKMWQIFTEIETSNYLLIYWIIYSSVDKENHGIHGIHGMGKWSA